MAAAVRKAKVSGHEAHTKEADAVRGMDGRVGRPIKLTFFGAGSSFCTTLTNDLLQIPGLAGGTLALVDTDAKRLGMVKRLIERRVTRARGAGRWTVIASTDRRRVMGGSDYLVNSIEVAGVQCVDADYDIPARYGVKQCIGDTLGPGGVFKGLRTIPVYLDILRDAERLCPDAIVLNYTNPMSMLCLAAARASSMRTLGLCHSVQGSSHLLAQRLGVPYATLRWECVGINHLAWFVTVRHGGRDQYPRLMRQARAEIYGKAEASDNADRDDVGRDIIRKDMMLQFGAYITESSGHLSEYLPYYRKRDDLLARYARNAYEGGSRFYADNWPTWRRDRDLRIEADLAKRRLAIAPRSWEYASWIIEAREKNTPWRVYGNVPNTTPQGGPLVADLLHDGCVELACMVDGAGWQPLRAPALPPQMAAVCRSNQAVIDLGARAAMEHSKELAIHALMLDPLTAAVCSPAEIRKMTLELFKAQKDVLPGYR